MRERPGSGWAFRLDGRLVHLGMVFVLCLMPMSCDGQKGSSGTDERFIVLVGETNRIYDLHAPEGAESAAPMPLVIALHGAGDSGPNFKKGAGIDKEADRRGFLAAYPSATGVNWAEGCNCTRPDLDGVDDVGFLDVIVDRVSQAYAVDPARIYVIGYSQGGLFAQRLACERSETYAGVATVAGMMSLPVAQSCTPPGSPDIMLIHGEEDDVLPFGGVPTGAYATLSVTDTFHFWRDRYDCPFGTQRTTVQSGGVTRDVLTSPVCRDGSRLRLDAMKNVGHAWPPFGPAEIADFFGL